MSGCRTAKISLVLGISVASAVLAGHGPQGGQAAPPEPFSPGETLTYDLSWQIFPAGEVVATLTKKGEDAKDAYEVKATGASRGFVSLLYTVHDEFTSVFDPHTVCSESISKKINEGRRRKDTRIVFDGARKLAILDERDLAAQGAPAKHAENVIPGCVQDVVSAFYFVRRQPLRVGEQIRLPINDGSKTSDVRLEVQALEKIRVPMGTQMAYRVEPTVFGGLLKRKGRMLVWFSDDERRLPLRIKAMISVGSITADLKSVTTSPAGPSPATHRGSPSRSVLLTSPCGTFPRPAARRLSCVARRSSTSGPPAQSQVRKRGLTPGGISPPAAAGIATGRAGRRFALCQEKGRGQIGAFRRRVPKLLRWGGRIAAEGWSPNRRPPAGAAPSGFPRVSQLQWPYGSRPRAGRLGCSGPGLPCAQTSLPFAQPSYYNLARQEAGGQGQKLEESPRCLLG